MRVLVVEDEPKLAALVARALREEGHPTDVAGRGEEALWMARSAPYEAIVLDVMLPDLDGFEICRRLRSQPPTANIPIIMLTALDQEEMRGRARQCGATEYLTKPFDPDRLMDAIRLRANGNGAAHP
jgi:two-component system OmpR family response regulator